MLIFYHYFFAMKKNIIIFSLFFLLLLSGCSLISKDTTSIESQVLPVAWQVVEMASSSLTGVATQVLEALKNKNAQALVDFVSFSGLRLSPYEYIDVQSGVILQKDQILSAFDNNENLLWWTYDGSGEPITLTLSSYRDKFIYDVDFLNSMEIGINTPVQRWNMINNIFDVYPSDTVIEYHFSWFDAQYSWMDWKSLWLVFENVGNTYLLKAIVHGQRTI